MHNLTLSWKNVTVEVSEKRKHFWKTSITKKTILDDISGTASNHSLTAIMGISGCGKTTLLSAISGRRRDNAGFILIDNSIISNKVVRDISGYVHQQDIFTEYMTVIEHLQFTAALKLSNKSKEKRHISIRKLLSELSLECQLKTLIKDLSGGERRRLSLAGELISSPIILFCDEPTTGLDSYSATVVVKKLQAIALSGKIVLTTIHQPSSQLFQYFNNIMLLAEGKLIFQGTREEAKIFFESMNLVCPQSYNPADFYIKCLTHEDVSRIREVFDIDKNERLHCNHFNISKEKIAKNNIFYELKWLLWRCYIENLRNKYVRLGGYICVLCEIIAVAFFYGQVSFSDENSVQSIQGFLAYIGSEFTFTNMYSVIYVFPGDLAVFLREKSLYSSSAYFLSKILSMVPLLLITTIIYMTILFSVVKFLNGIYLWIQMTYMAFLVGLVSCGLGLAFSANFSTVEHVDLFMGPFEFTLLLLGGLLIKLDNIPIVFSWIKFLAPFYYSFDSLSNLVWRNITNFSNCTGSETVVCYKNSSQVLQAFGVYNTYDTIRYDILYLHILTTVFCFIGFVGILRRKYYDSI